MNVVLEPDTHTYRREDGTAVCASVTTVLADVGIVNYSMLSDAERDFYLTRGTAIHAATQFDDEETLDESTLDPQIAPYLEAWRKFRRDTGFIPTRIEGPVYHSVYHYAGTPDRVGSIISNCTSEIVVDIKSGVVCPWVKYQLAAYCAALDPKHPGRFRRIGVQLQETGEPIVTEFPPKELTHDLGVFLSALTVYNAKHERRKAA